MTSSHSETPTWEDGEGTERPKQWFLLSAGYGTLTDQITDSNCVAKIKIDIGDLKEKETIVPSKATKARKQYVTVINIDWALLICKLQSVKLRSDRR